MDGSLVRSSRSVRWARGRQKAARRGRQTGSCGRLSRRSLRSETGYECQSRSRHWSGFSGSPRLNCKRHFRSCSEHHHRSRRPRSKRLPTRRRPHQDRRLPPGRSTVTSGKPSPVHAASSNAASTKPARTRRGMALTSRAAVGMSISTGQRQDGYEGSESSSASTTAAASVSVTPASVRSTE